MHTKEFDKLIRGTVNKTRAKDYGHPADHFAVSAALKATIRKAFRGDPRLLHVLEMSVIKWLDSATLPITSTLGSTLQATPAQL